MIVLAIISNMVSSKNRVFVDGYRIIWNSNFELLIMFRFHNIKINLVILSPGLVFTVQRLHAHTLETHFMLTQ